MHGLWSTFKRWSLGLVLLSSCGTEVPSTTVRVTLQVDVGTDYRSDISVSTQLSAFNDVQSVEFVDPNGDGVYIGTLEVPVNETLYYRFVKGPDINGCLLYTSPSPRD